MKNQTSIRSIGIHLPSEVRTNDWWPEHIVERWARNRTRKMNEPRSQEESLPPGASVIAEEVAALGSDPFVGAKLRRVIGSGLQSSDMEVEASLDALARGGMRADEIDLLLVSSLLPDRIGLPNAYVVHRRLGLSSRCLTMQGDSACNSFLMQLELADALITRGTVRNALLVQSACISRVGKIDDPSSAWFGDGASAVIVSRSSGEGGILGRAHTTDSTMYRAFHMSVDDARWYDDGRVWVQLDDPATARRIVHGSLDALREVSHRALADASCLPDQVDFYGGHPATPFAVKTSKSYIGLNRAKTIDTFPFLANLASANIPMVLAHGEREGLLRPGEIVLMAGGGAGGSWSSMVARWGS